MAVKQKVTVSVQPTARHEPRHSRPSRSGHDGAAMGPRIDLTRRGSMSRARSGVVWQLRFEQVEECAGGR